MTQTLYLVDGSGYLFRAFHAMPNLTASDGTPTGAIYGITNMLRRLLTEYQPVHAAVIFDAKGENFRHQLFPAYKANRPPMPEDLAAQIPFIHDIVDAMGFPRLVIDGVEADDVIGSLTQQALADGMTVKIFTGDKDLAQLVNDKVTLINTMNDTVLDEAGVEAKFNVKPTQIIDYLALMGDTVDNVPGVPKVGPKTAAKWLAEYGSLDNLIASADKIKGKVGENLRAALDDLPLSKQLVALKNDLKLGETPQTLVHSAADTEALRTLYTRLGFRSWLREVDHSEIPPRPPFSKGETKDTAPLQKEEAENVPPLQKGGAGGDLKTTYHCITTQADLDTWLDKLKKARLFAFDTETTSLNYMQAQIVGVSFAIEVGEAAYVPLAHDYLNAPAQLDRKAVLQALKPLLEDPAYKKIGQHLKYDAHVLRHYAIELRGIEFDTMLESYVLNSTASQHNMDALAAHYLQYQTTKYAEKIL